MIVERGAFRGASLLAGLGLIVCAVMLSGGAAAEQTVFRAGTETIAVDVQVIDRAGLPIMTLGPQNFSVNIAGGRRKVTTADLIRVDSVPGESSASSASGAAALTSPAPADAARVFVLAFDVFSFGVGESRAVVAAAQEFIKQLRPIDLVGLYTFPVGVRISATTDHHAVARRVDTVVGQQDALKSQFNLTVTEIVDINAEDTAAGGRATTAAAGYGPVTRRVMVRECSNPNDGACGEAVQIEAQALGFYLEQRITQGVHGLSSLVQYLGTLPGRKAVVLLSGGMPVSDRMGGKPDVGDAAKLIGQDAAKANTVLYSLFVDTTQGMLSAEKRKVDRGQELGRAHALMGRMLDRVAVASGGTMLEVLLGGGEQALSRILTETSSHYLIGVEPTNADRDGEPRRLDVKVNVSGATVRSRQWVVIPRR